MKHGKWITDILAEMEICRRKLEIINKGVSDDKKWGLCKQYRVDNYGIEIVIDDDISKHTIYMNKIDNETTRTRDLSRIHYKE